MDYKFSISNFKTFGANGKLAEFEIRPITILTGPNNSGKSHLAKFIDFLKNNIDVNVPIIDLKDNNNEFVIVDDITCKNLEKNDSIEFCIDVNYYHYHPKVLVTLNKKGDHLQLNSIKYLICDQLVAEFRYDLTGIVMKLDYFINSNH